MFGAGVTEGFACKDAARPRFRCLGQKVFTCVAQGGRCGWLWGRTLGTLNEARRRLEGRRTGDFEKFHM